MFKTEIVDCIHDFDEMFSEIIIFSAQKCFC